MKNDTKSVAGVTSLAYHSTMWIVVIAGLLANVMVLVWRCWRKESKHSLLSVLIISLAFADLLFCCHYLLEEVMLANPVLANANKVNGTVHITTVDERLCLSVLFFAGVSTNAVMLTAVAIALATFFSFHLHRHGNRVITWFLAISWMSCLAFGGLLVWKYRPIYQAVAKTALDVNTFSLFVVYECTGTIRDIHWNVNVVPIIVTTVNAMASLVVAVIYIYLWCTLRKRDLHTSFTHLRSQEITHFRIRLTIISGLNLLCWWPACALYWFASVDNRTVLNGTPSPIASEPVLLITAAVSFANPIIYTIASKRFLEAARRACAFLFCRRRKTEWILTSPDTRVPIYHPESVTENTEESSLFSESK